jgi:AraC-like DNA-binding protein
VVQAIRHWLETDPLAKTGWLGALQDSQIGQAIALIHRYPTEAWSVESLASRIGVSRSSFAARFMSLVGEPPMHYVRQWRFHVATRWLEDSDTPIADIAERLDYNSEAAFGRAFKKFTGRTPGAVRRGDDSAIASVV